MREIKFRVWDNVDYMSNPFTLQDLQKGKIGFTDECKVMEYTGLKDKNGKEIYEGDIVKYTSSIKYDPLNNRMVYVGQIQNWVGQMGVGFRYKSGRHTMMLKLGHSFNMEVIGNIHEQPELIKY